MPDDKKAKKAAMKAEADKLGISYEELKQRKKASKKKREFESLDTEEHKSEVKRLRTYSKDFDENERSADDDTGNSSNKRPRTRSVDLSAAEEEVTKEEKKLSPEEWRKEHTLTLRGHGASNGMLMPPPYIDFHDTPYSSKIQTTLTRAGFVRPTAIQAQCWPLAVDGKDLICIAKTGSGKTCGFLLPVFHKQQSENGGNSVRGNKVLPLLLVLAPTRELSVQILEETQKFGRPLGIRSVCCYGGAPKYPQIAALDRGVECIIACPGRLNDLIEMRKVDLSAIKYLVLDEADRMLDMVSLFWIWRFCLSLRATDSYDLLYYNLCVLVSGV